jgi:hypothetical protein
MTSSSPLTNQKEREEKDVAVAAAAKLIFRPIGHGQLRSTTKKKIPNSSSSSPSVASNLTNWYEPKDQPPQIKKI